MAELGGIIVHDHLTSCFTIEGVDHALCNAHHLRELQARFEIEHADWARQMQILLRRPAHAAISRLHAKRRWTVPDRPDRAAP